MTWGEPEPEAAVEGDRPSLARTAAVPANQDVVGTALRLVAALARATVGGADGASISLRQFDRLNTVAASDDTVLEMDGDQYETGEGPCVDASREGRWFHVEALDAETRWPAFIPRASRRGINSILSSPIIAPLGPVGALNIYSRMERAFATPDQELAALLATHASAVVASAHIDLSAEQAAARLQEALRVREVIALAQGVLMAREGLTAEGAHASLRQLSKRTSVPLASLAEQILASTRGELPDPSPSSEPQG